MSRATSFLLDALRVAAALAVFAGHCILFWYPAEMGTTAAHMGHRAVIVFFVLSGYVIAASTLGRSRDARAYVLARLSRLYSVVVPALALTFLVGCVGKAINPAAYQPFQHGHGALSYFLTLFFFQSVWCTNTAPPENGPFWSLGYEFWYYALFGAAVLIASRRWKIAVLLALVLLVGTNVLLLLPAWVMGVWLYVYGRRVTLPFGAALVGAVLSFVAFGAAVELMPDWPGHAGLGPWFFSNACGSDNVLALVLTALIFFLDQAFRDLPLPMRLGNSMRWLADHTFSLYLYHFPLLFFAGAVIPFDRSNSLQVGGVIGLVLGVILLLSILTEARRGKWRAFFAWGWDWVTFKKRSS